MDKYQGKEITATLQANTKVELNKLIAGLNRYAKANHLETVKVLSKAKDPDGGYKAIVEAHNWNPLKSLKESYHNRPTPEEIAELRKHQQKLKIEKLKREKEEVKAKKEVVQAKQSLAQEKLELVQAKTKVSKAQNQAKQVKAAHPSMLKQFLDFDPAKQEPKYKLVKYGVVQNKPKSKARKKQSSVPRMVTIRMA